MPLETVVGGVDPGECSPPAACQQVVRRHRTLQARPRGRRAFLMVPTPADRPTAFDRLFVSAARNGPDADAVGRIPGDLPDADRPKDPTVGQREGHHAPIGLQCALARGATVSRPDFNLPALKAKA